MRILLSAYACEPQKGSEPGVGWEWAIRLSQSHDVTVITRANNQQIIEQELINGISQSFPKFIYIDLPKSLIYLKRIGVVSVSLYYLLWQLLARFKLRKRFQEFDIIHHVTFNGFRFPGAWWQGPIPVVLGPLGGASLSSSKFRRSFGKKWYQEWLRSLSVRLWWLNPWTQASLRCANAVVTVGEELGSRFAPIGIQAISMLETGIPQNLEKDMEVIDPKAKQNFLLIGNLEPWKGWQIAFEAFAQAIQGGMKMQRLIVVGKGSQLKSAQKLASTLHLADHVEFVGQLPRPKVWQLLQNARALIFSSIRDTSGNVVLEAMVLRCPVVCFRHQGVGWITDEMCSIRIEPNDWESSVNGFSQAMQSLAKNDALVAKMGTYGRERALSEFTWSAKITAMKKIYEQAINKYKST